VLFLGLGFSIGRLTPGNFSANALDGMHKSSLANLFDWMLPSSDEC